MSETISPSSNIGAILIVLFIVLIGLAFYFFIYRNLNKKNDDEINIATPAEIRMTAVEVQKLIDDYAIKDANGVPTLHYNGGFENPDLSRFPLPDMQRMLQNGWWFAMINDSGANNLNGYRQGTNGLYVLSFLDRRNVASPINAGKSGITVPVQLAPYI